MIEDLLSALAIVGAFVMCGAVGWACERAFARPAEHEDKPKITVR